MSSAPRFPSELRRVALFDLDGTLTHLDTERQWVFLLGEVGLLDPEPFNAFHRDYQAGVLNLEDYYNWYLAVFERVPMDQLAELRDRLVTERMLPSIEPRATAWIAEERERNDAVLLATASNSFLTESIGAGLGLDDVLATRLEERDGRFTGKIAGSPCYQHGKLDHLAAWLAARDTRLEDLEATCFYSDSHNDLPLLEAVHRPVVVSPDEKLALVAQERGWKVYA